MSEQRNDRGGAWGTLLLGAGHRDHFLARVQPARMPIVPAVNLAGRVIVPSFSIQNTRVGSSLSPRRPGVLFPHDCSALGRPVFVTRQRKRGFAPPLNIVCQRPERSRQANAQVLHSSASVTAVSLRPNRSEHGGQTIGFRCQSNGAA